MFALQLCLAPAFVVSALGYADFPFHPSIPSGVVALVFGLFGALVFVLVTNAHRIPALISLLPFIGKRPITM